MTDQLQAENEMLKYWLLRAYTATRRQGWEDGPTESETLDNICSVLANLGLDAANNPREVEEMLKRKPVFFVDKLNDWESVFHNVEKLNKMESDQ